MSYQLSRTIDYFQSTTDGRIKLDSLVKILQNAALNHVHEADRDSRVLIAAGYAWILNRIRIDILRHPLYGETLTVRTWHRGARGYKSYRDYEILAGDETVALAASAWLFLDLERRRVVRVPKETNELYGVNPAAALDHDIEEWRPVKKLDPEFTVDITTRRSDYDMLGHVNNAAYFDYLDTLMHRFIPEQQALTSVAIQYNREINGRVDLIRAGISSDGPGRYPFILYDDSGLYACGEIGTAAAGA
ncbi:MAG: acyl-[acyl-carrier-protein] thioesterase [Desulfosudaceae bacterium]